MLKERIIQSLGIWLLISFFILLFGISQWDLPPITAVFNAAILGLYAFLRFGSLMDSGSNTVEELINPDRAVIGTVRAWNDDKTIWYIAQVKRNYQDAVFAAEKEFEGIVEAKEWLAATYEEELNKHHQRMQEQEPINHSH